MHLPMNSDKKPERLDLRVFADTKAFAVFQLNSFLLNEFGLGFKIKAVIKPLFEESSGVWRCILIVDPQGIK